MTFLRAAFVAAALAAALPASAGELVLTFKDGLVSLKAADVPLRQILNEWSRLGGTRIVGMEKLGGGLVTLELVDVPEKKALEVLLRPIAGYIVAPRAAMAAGASRYDRIALLPTSIASAAPIAAPRPRAFAPPPIMLPDPIQLANGQDEQGEPGEATPSPVPVFSPNGEPLNPGIVPGAVPPSPIAPGQNPLRPFQQPPPDPNAPVPVTPAPTVNTPLVTDRPGVIPVPQQPQTQPRP